MAKKKSTWRSVKRILLFLFIAHLVYIIGGIFLNPPITITQLASLLKGHGLKRDQVSFAAQGYNAKLAFLAGEDQLFPKHNGFDFKSIEKAMKHNEKNPKRRRGASTISQQTAKNVYLWQGGGYFRKGLEVYFTFMIEKIWRKRRILETYMNVAQTGKGVFGIQAAAKKYFNKDAKDLTRVEAAQIAASLPNPEKYTVKPLSKYVSRRSAILLRQMKNLETDPAIRALISEK